MSVRYQAMRYFLWLVALGGLGLVGNLQGWLLEAGTITGTAVTLGGLDNLAKTVQDYAEGNVGKMVAIIMVMGGLGMSLSGRMGSGLGVAGTGVAAAFAPNIIGTAFDTTTAAPLTPVLQAAPPLLVTGWLAQAGLALLWPLAVALKLVRDPVVWLSLGFAALLRPGLVVAWVRNRRVPA